jgi:hypothetical protein
MGQLVALQGDPILEIRREALKFIQIEDEKRPTFLDNRLLEGVELGFMLQMEIIGKSMPIDDADPMSITGDLSSSCGTSGDTYGGGGGTYREKTSIFGPLYVSCIQSSKKRRTDFIVGLLRRAQQISQTVRQITASMNSCGGIGIGGGGGGGGCGGGGCGGGSNFSSAGTGASGYDTVAAAAESKSSSPRAGQSSSTSSSSSSSSALFRNNKSPTTSATTSSTTSPRSFAASSVEAVREIERQFSLLDFMITTLAYLPFEFAEEPLQVRNSNFNRDNEL